MASGHRLETGFDLPSAEDIHQALTDTAASYLHLGWSVVPLWGDNRPEQAKIPAVAWAQNQRRRADEQQIARWFTGTPYRGLGIVTGKISQLIVLDFDDEALSKRFGTHYPELTATRTVRTRRGQHLYFRLPPHLHVPSRKLAGVDLLSDGCYVVAPPTVINGHPYTVERGGLPKTLTQADIVALQRFLDAVSVNRATSRYNGLEVRFKDILATPHSKPQEAAFSAQHTPLNPDGAFLTADHLIMRYRAMAGASHRNDALFKTACLARDHGWKREAVAAVLAGVHAMQPARSRHRRERLRTRRREAERTINSAFSKPPRPVQPKDTGGLFNSIREKLLQLGQTFVVRVIEGLRLAGLKAGQLVTERKIIQLLRGIVGQHSVRKTLAATTPDGTPIFERISPRSPPRCAAANHIRIDRQPNAVVNAPKPQLNHGRPQRHYRMPTPEALCTALGVAPSGSDPVTQDDLRSAKQTRQALQRGLIQRRPGTYLRKWLGDRLGVSERTLSRYNAQIDGLHVVPTFTQTPLGWSNLNAIPAPEVMPAGTCLEDSSGKRWPAFKGIARKLLRQGRGVRLLVRSLNYYWVGQGDPPTLPNGLEVQRQIDIGPLRETPEPIVTFAQQVARLVRTVGGPTPTPPASTAPPVRASKPPPPAPIPTTQATKRPRKRVYWKPLPDPDAERLATRAYDTLNQRTALPEHKVSLVSARQWVDTFGAAAVASALNAFANRRDVTKPAGWFKTVLRSTAAASSP